MPGFFRKEAVDAQSNRQVGAVSLAQPLSLFDMATEEKITEQIQTLKMTRFIIAHRLETISQADSVLELRNGKLNVVSPGQLQVESYKTSA